MMDINQILGELNKVSVLHGPAIRAFLFVDGDITEVHWFKLTAFKDDKFYTTVTSYNAIRTREAKRLYDAMKRSQAYKKANWPKYRSSFTALEDLSKAELELDVHTDLPTFYHATLWDYYKAVGYDFKKQRYVRKD